MVCLMILQSLASTFFATLCKNIKVHVKNLVKDEEKLCSKIPKPEMDVHNPSLIHLNTFMYSFIHVRIIQPQILTLLSLIEGDIFRSSQASKIYLIHFFFPNITQSFMIKCLVLGQNVQMKGICQSQENYSGYKSSIVLI